MRIDANSTIAIVIDVQEKILPVMDEADRVLTRTTTLVEGLRVLEVPIIATEQYPKGLGPTVARVQSAFESWEPVEKTAFSCCDAPDFMTLLEARPQVSTVLVAGIEAHVCVLQTAIDLQLAGYNPVVVADATSSRKPTDTRIAFSRCRAEGVRLTTTESVLFELTRTSRNPAFRTISRLIQ